MAAATDGSSVLGNIAIPGAANPKSESTTVEKMLAECGVAIPVAWTFMSELLAMRRTGMSILHSVVLESQRKLDSSATGFEK